MTKFIHSIQIMLGITKYDKSMSNFPKPKPNILKSWKPNNNAFLKHKLTCASCPITPCLMKPNTEFIEGKDGAKIRKHSCNITKCNNSVWYCKKCGK